MYFYKALLNNYYYFTAVILFVIGFYTLLSNTNLIKKIIGLNIMDTAIFLLFISIGYVKSGSAPIIDLANKQAVYVNPLPSALILTGIVVAVSVTAYALALTIKLYEHYGSIDLDIIFEMRRQVIK